MKIFFRNLTLLLLLLPCATSHIYGTASSSVHTTTVPATTPVTPEVQQMLTRLETIRAMDLKGMERAEKRMLRKEVKEIKSTLQAANNTVYLSVGAIIIIVLLIILLL